MIPRMMEVKAYGRLLGYYLGLVWFLITVRRGIADDREGSV